MKNLYNILLYIFLMVLIGVSCQNEDSELIHCVEEHFDKGNFKLEEKLLTDYYKYENIVVIRNNIGYDDDFFIEIDSIEIILTESEVSKLSEIINKYELKINNLVHKRFTDKCK